MVKAIQHEARGESVTGQVAVAHVIMNRLKHPNFPKTICQVIYQSRQFSYLQNSKTDYTDKQSVETAVFVLKGWIDDPTKGALYFYAHSSIRPRWASTLPTTAKIGNHTFKGEYRSRVGKRAHPRVCKDGTRND
jgi:spore germination cell wall hydrolase CwlJ-like protein